MKAKTVGKLFDPIDVNVEGLKDKIDPFVRVNEEPIALFVDHRQEPRVITQAFLQAVLEAKQEAKKYKLLFEKMRDALALRSGAGDEVEDGVHRLRFSVKSTKANQHGKLLDELLDLFVKDADLRQQYEERKTKASSKDVVYIDGQEI